MYMDPLSDQATRKPQATPRHGTRQTKTKGTKNNVQISEREQRGQEESGRRKPWAASSSSSIFSSSSTTPTTQPSPRPSSARAAPSKPRASAAPVASLTQYCSLRARTVNQRSAEEYCGHSSGAQAPQGCLAAEPGEVCSVSVGLRAYRTPHPPWPWCLSSVPVGRRTAAQCGASQLPAPQ